MEAKQPIILSHLLSRDEGWETFRCRIRLGLWTPNSCCPAIIQCSSSSVQTLLFLERLCFSCTILTTTQRCASKSQYISEIWASAFFIGSLCSSSLIIAVALDLDSSSSLFGLISFGCEDSCINKSAKMSWL